MKKNILETYNWLNEAFVHQTQEETEEKIIKANSLPDLNTTEGCLQVIAKWLIENGKKTNRVKLPFFRKNSIRDYRLFPISNFGWDGYTKKDLTTIQFHLDYDSFANYEDDEETSWALVSMYIDMDEFERYQKIGCTKIMSIWQFDFQNDFVTEIEMELIDKKILKEIAVDLMTKEWFNVKEYNYL